MRTAALLAALALLLATPADARSRSDYSGTYHAPRASIYHAPRVQTFRAPKAPRYHAPRQPRASSTYNAPKPYRTESSYQRAAGGNRDGHGRYKRSERAKSEFKWAHPCPSTGRSSGACPGYVIDHVQALKHGGRDAPDNMQWQTVEAAKAKDRVE